MSDHLTLLKTHFSDYKLNTRQSEFITTCPLCGKEKHFYINVHDLLFICFHCGETGNDKVLYKSLGIQIEKVVDFNRELVSLKNLMKPIEEEVYNYETPLIPPPLYFLRVGFHNYLKERNFRERDYHDNIVGICNILPSFNKRVIFLVEPYFMNNDTYCKGFVARSIDREEKKRYQNSDYTEFSKLLYGFEKIRKGQTDTVILVEGIFDRRKITSVLDLYDNIKIKCLSTLGKRVSNYQIQKLRDIGIKNVILFYDKDALEEIKYYSFELAKYFNVNVITTEGKDPDESTDIEVLECFNKLMSPFEFFLSKIRNVRKK